MSSDDYYEIKTPPAEPLLTLAVAKSFAKVDEDITRDDTLISGLITALTNQGEAYTGRVFVSRVFTGHFEGMETSNRERYPYIVLRQSPLISVTSVKVILDDALVDVDSDNYQLKTKSGYSRLLFNVDVSCDDVPYPLQVEFSAGYGEAGDVPEDIKTGVGAHLAFVYENRGDVSPDGRDGKMGMPIQVQAIYSNYHILEVF